MRYRVWLLLVVCLLTGDLAAALDRVDFKRDAHEQSVEGRVLAKADDGGLLLESADGVLWSLQAEEIVRHQTDALPFVPLAPAELAKQLLSQLPEGFEAHYTQNYVIVHNASKAYAQWCGTLFEQLYRAFTNYWSRKGFDIKKPAFPLVAVVFADKQSYARYVQQELGSVSDSIIGYYSLQSNRMTMYDLTGVQQLRRPGARRTTAAQINEMLSSPDASRMVATIVHEATHQVAFNCGLQQRFADIPLWLCEGMAIYFETPDLQSSTGWRTIGSVNRVRLQGFREYLPRRKPESLKTLLVDDDRMRDSRTALDAYAEAWALNYFLIRQRPKQYVEYLKVLGQKPPLAQYSAETRLREFQQAFGENLGQLDAEFLRYMSKVR
ncbi:MAG TPA: DUF1570 domain-containing protein [Pirellulales bacterium]|jgi:hypothetical protein|nr:DUF1570 domain-containing protein [Pirellulales bacterium]